MPKRIFITATNTDIGKTFVTVRLLKQYASMGYRVGVIKPIETGVAEVPLDGTKLHTLLQSLNPAATDLSVNDIVPLQFALPAAPYCANDAQAVDLSIIDAAIEKIEAVCDILIIEGAGGLYVPIDKDTMMIDLIERYDSKALLVSHCKLGCINDTILSIKAMQDRTLDFAWTLNCHQDDQDFYQTSEPYFRDNFPEFTIFERDIVKIADTLLL
ncbi:dethiobiotin synthase [Sulfurimonas sp. HSL3-7]|uniref:dethiobiotin synthase n=1 Tax=Sulfonitrofixus jiaomeiensis TaxID=3131938 RepID=UPI0031F97AB9